MSSLSFSTLSFKNGNGIIKLGHLAPCQALSVDGRRCLYSWRRGQGLAPSLLFSVGTLLPSHLFPVSLSAQKFFFTPIAAIPDCRINCTFTTLVVPASQHTFSSLSSTSQPEPCPHSVERVLVLALWPLLGAQRHKHKTSSASS